MRVNDEAFENGFQALTLGLNFTDNPYHPQREHYLFDAWNWGYTHAFTLTEESL